MKKNKNRRPRTNRISIIYCNQVFIVNVTKSGTIFQKSTNSDTIGTVEDDGRVLINEDLLKAWCKPMYSLVLENGLAS